MGGMIAARLRPVRQTAQPLNGRLYLSGDDLHRRPAAVLLDLRLEYPLQPVRRNAELQHAAQQPAVVRMIVEFRRFVAKLAPVAQLPHPAHEFKVRRLVVPVQTQQPIEWLRMPVQAAANQVLLEAIQGDAVLRAVEFAEILQARGV